MKVQFSKLSWLCHRRSLSFFRIAVVGSGPSGFYAAKYLVEKIANARVDIIEKYPTPYGLIRYGVAPDHQDVKAVMDSFIEIASNPRIQYFGNVNVGVDACLHELLNSYSAVVLAMGASSNKKLGIRGEDEVDESKYSHCGSAGVLSARSFVYWYNGHPEYKWVGDLMKSKKQSLKNVLIVGHGNVAIDCARILTKSAAELSKSDIMPDALKTIEMCGVQNIHMVGRRGHVQASFTIKEVRELSRLPGVKLHISAEELSAGLTSASVKEIELSRPKKRIVELLNVIASDTSDTNIVKHIYMRFLVHPEEIVLDKSQVVGLRVFQNQLIGDANRQGVIVNKDTQEVIPADLILRSVGFESDVPVGLAPEYFDRSKHVVNNIGGRVLSSTSKKQLEKLYVTGWLKRGPTGIVGTNIPDAKETVECVVEDIKTLPEVIGEQSPLLKLLPDNHPIVSWEQYLRINKEEVLRGSTMNKPRLKFDNIHDMLKVARDS